MQLRREKLKKSTVVTIIFAILAIAAVIVVAIIAYQKYKEANADGIDDDAYNLSDDYDDSYVTETKFIGGIGYPEVYKIPFGKTGSYIKNKELWVKHPEIIPEAVAHAEAFADEIVNISYRKILEDKDAYVKDVMQYMDESWLIDEGSEDEMFMWDYIEQFAEEQIDNKTVTSGHFITDTSLCYEDHLLYVRGMVEFEDHSESSENEEQQVCMMEIVMHRSMEDALKFEVVDWYQIDYEDEIK